MRRLHEDGTDAKEEELYLSPLETVVISLLADVKTGTVGYLKPKSKSSPVVDALRSDDGSAYDGFQVTASDDHKPSTNGSRRFFRLLATPKTFRMFFVVPDDKFGTFPYMYQKYVKADGKTMEPQGVVKCVEQWVLLLAVVEGKK